MTDSSSQPLKYTVTHYRQPEHTHEEFINWIIKVHLPLALPVLKKHGVLEYSLFETPSAVNEAAKQEMGKFRPDWDFADFDCFLEYTLPSVETIKNVLSDPDWVVAVQDQDEWVDMGRALVSLGYSTPYLLKTGEIVNLKK
ncbi:hypothetical protein V8F06_005955 [Rhypophila decipiens]